MWTYNVTRALLEKEGFDLIPREIPTSELDLIEEAFAKAIGPGRIYCIKTHKLLKCDLNDTKIITNYRDVRDSMLSFMKFMRLEKTDNFFDTAMKIIKGQMTTTDYYFTHFTTNLRIRYDDIVSEPMGVIKLINKYLGLKVGQRQMLVIEERFSKKNVKKLLSNLDKVAVSKQGEIKDDKSSVHYDTVRNRDGTYRIFDKKTAFQTYHITEQGSRNWKDYFSSEQQDEINNAVSDWLVKYGFTI
jgi:hypothetical protein